MISLDCEKCEAVYHVPAASNYDKKRNEVVDKDCPFCKKDKNMTKVYQGGDTYHLHMISGKVFDVTAEEFNEIAEESPVVEDLREELAEVKNELNEAKEVATNIGHYLEDIQKTLEDNEEDMADEISRLILEARRELEEI